MTFATSSETSIYKKWRRKSREIVISEGLANIKYMQSNRMATLVEFFYIFVYSEFKNTCTNKIKSYLRSLATSLSEAILHACVTPNRQII